MPKNKITVILEIYNESERIKECLSDFSWAEEIVVFVKKSSDNSLELAKKYATHVYEVEYCNASENIINNSKLHDTLEWCFYITASSRIDIELAKEIVKITNNPTFSYDVIGLPYEMNVFNISGSQSPWCNDYKFPLIRKSALKLSTILHQEVGWIGNNIFLINSSHISGRFKHITHQNPNDFFLKHNRYVQYEAKHYIEIYSNKSYYHALNKLLRSVAFVTIKRRTIFKGKDGFTVSIAYISYFIMLLVYVWYYSRNKTISNS